MVITRDAIITELTGYITFLFAKVCFAMEMFGEKSREEASQRNDNFASALGECVKEFVQKWQRCGRYDEEEPSQKMHKLEKKYKENSAQLRRKNTATVLEKFNKLKGELSTIIDQYRREINLLTSPADFVEKTSLNDTNREFSAYRNYKLAILLKPFPEKYGNNRQGKKTVEDLSIIRQEFNQHFCRLTPLTEAQLLKRRSNLRRAARDSAGKPKGSKGPSPFVGYFSRFLIESENHGVPEEDRMPTDAAEHDADSSMNDSDYSVEL